MDMYHIFRKIPLSKWGRNSFIRNLPDKAVLLDVGCGNSSPAVAKYINPTLYYIGVDVGDYNVTKNDLEYADEYYLFSPDQFAGGIASIKVKADAVISKHNIEHCNHPMKTIDAMCTVLKSGGGFLYLAFPNALSVKFPSRKGTLNFYDDHTHRYLPDKEQIISRLHKNGMEILKCADPYKPVIYWMAGLAAEPFSRAKKKVCIGTWAYYGFETVIWAKKK